MQRQSNNGWAACIRASLHGQLDHDRGISCAIASNFDADDADADNDADDDGDDDDDDDNDDDNDDYEDGENDDDDDDDDDDADSV